MTEEYTNYSYEQEILLFDGLKFYITDIEDIYEKNLDSAAQEMTHYVKIKLYSTSENIPNADLKDLS